MLSGVLSAFYDATSMLVRHQVEKRAILENLDLVTLALDETVDDGIILEKGQNNNASRVSRPRPDVNEIQINEQSKFIFPAWLPRDVKAWRIAIASKLQDVVPARGSAHARRAIADTLRSLDCIAAIMSAHIRVSRRRVAQRILQEVFERRRVSRPCPGPRLHSPSSDRTFTIALCSLSTCFICTLENAISWFAISITFRWRTDRLRAHSRRRDPGCCGMNKSSGDGGGARDSARPRAVTPCLDNHSSGGCVSAINERRWLPRDEASCLIVCVPHGPRVLRGARSRIS